MFKITHNPKLRIMNRLILFLISIAISIPMLSQDIVLSQSVIGTDIVKGEDSYTLSNGYQILSGRYKGEITISGVSTISKV